MCPEARTPALSRHARGPSRLATVGRQVLAGLLLLAVGIPAYAGLEETAVGPVGEQAARLGAQYFQAHWAGVLLGVVAVIVLGLLVKTPSPERWVARWSSALCRLPVAALGAIAGGVAASVSAWIATAHLGRSPVLLDGISQWIQSRYFAAGALAGPPLPDPAFWQLQFMVITDGGWASQYPPGFAAVLALGWTAGSTWWVGPVLLGVAIFLTALVAERLLEPDRLAARLGVLLMAGSAFLAFHAAASMNHVLATALIALAWYASLRALDGRWPWALLAGAAVGATFATRPYVAAVLGPLATVGVWALAASERSTVRGWALRLGAALLGALPPVVATLWYNARLFGDPLRFGYTAAAGPSHGLGFHVDPWGAPYGLGEALRYTSIDLLSLSLDLLQSPVPVVVLVASALVLHAGWRRRHALLVAWALLPVAANLLYWHHDLFFGPRLLYEAAPAWCLLASTSALVVLRGLPRAGPSARILHRTAVGLTLALAWFVGVLIAGPARVRGQAELARVTGMTVRAPAVDEPTLVFVHEDWESRLGARMSALGVRLDSLRAALRLNTTCEVDRFVRARETGHGSDGPSLSFAGPSRRPLRVVQMDSGSRIRTEEGELLDDVCRREAAADLGGVDPLAPLLWQGDLPGLIRGGALYVRDLGPERNDALLLRFPTHRPALLARTGGEAVLLPYRPAIEARWSPAYDASGPASAAPGTP